MRRFINLEEANFNLKRREEILEKLAEKIIYESTQQDEYDLGKESFLLKRASKHSKWGHQKICNCIVVDNEALEEKYGFENKVPDLTVTLNENYIYITSDEKECRVGKSISLNEPIDVCKVVSMIKYIIRNGFTELFSNKDYAEMKSYINEESASSFYRRHIELKNAADLVLDYMVEYGDKIGFGLEIYNPNHKHGIGLLDKKIILTSSQNWYCKEHFEDSFVGIEYDEHDIKISFVNNFYRIKLSSRYAYFEVNSEEIAKIFVNIFKFFVENGNVKIDNKSIDEDDND